MIADFLSETMQARGKRHIIFQVQKEKNCQIRAGIYKMSLVHPVVPRSKEVFKRKKETQ